MTDNNIRSLRVFLCHSSSDKPFVKKLYERLVNDGVDAWLDKEKLLPGQDWQIEISNAVQSSDVVIVFLSSQSITKEGFVQKEIKLALDTADEKPEGTIYIIPAKIEDCDTPKRISKYQWVDLFLDNGYELLSKALEIRAHSLGITFKKKTLSEKNKQQSVSDNKPELPTYSTTMGQPKRTSLLSEEIIVKITQGEAFWQSGNWLPQFRKASGNLYLTNKRLIIENYKKLSKNEKIKEWDTPHFSQIIKVEELGLFEAFISTGLIGRKIVLYFKDYSRLTLIPVLWNDFDGFYTELLSQIKAFHESHQ